jgi:hypothetical protein
MYRAMKIIRRFAEAAPVFSQTLYLLLRTLMGILSLGIARGRHPSWRDVSRSRPFVWKIFGGSENGQACKNDVSNVA